jgi:hypothetical protein
MQQFCYIFFHYIFPSTQQLCNNLSFYPIRCQFFCIFSLSMHGKILQSKTLAHKTYCVQNCNVFFVLCCINYNLKIPCFLSPPLLFNAIFICRCLRFHIKRIRGFQVIHPCMMQQSVKSLRYYLCVTLEKRQFPSN